MYYCSTVELLMNYADKKKKKNIGILVEKKSCALPEAIACQCPLDTHLL